MKDQDPVIAALAALDPHPGGADPTGGEPQLSEMKERIMASPAAPLRPRSHLSSGLVVGAVSVMVVALVAGLLFSVRGRSTHAPTSEAGSDRSAIVLRLEPSPTEPRVTVQLARTEVLQLQARVAALGVHGITVHQLGRAEIAVNASPAERSVLVTAFSAAGSPVEVTDWEGNLVAPNGQTVASQLLGFDSAARLLSQGRGNMNPGSPSAGAVPLERAIVLAATQSPRFNASARAQGGDSQYFAFARSGEAGCHATKPTCYRAGPTSARSALHAKQGDQVLAVPHGTAVVQAISGTGNGADYSDPAARYFVLRDDVALSTREVSGAHLMTDSAGQTSIYLTLTQRGAQAFQVLTRTVATRGLKANSGNGQEYQHFAVISDGALLTVAAVNYKDYPIGHVRQHNIELVGRFSTVAAKRIVFELQLRLLPLKLEVVSRN